MKSKLFESSTLYVRECENCPRLFFIRQPIMISLPGNLLSTLGNFKKILNFPVNKSRVIHFFSCEIIFTTKEIIFMVFHKWIFRFFRYNQSYNLRRSINGAIIVLARDPWTLTARSEDQVVGPLSPGFKYEMFKFNETSGCTNIRQIPRKEFFFSKNIYGFFF